MFEVGKKYRCTNLNTEFVTVDSNDFTVGKFYRLVAIDEQYGKFVSNNKRLILWVELSCFLQCLPVEKKENN